MARDRQRSKARQQQRREQRLAQRRESAALGGRPEEALDDPADPKPVDGTGTDRTDPGPDKSARDDGVGAPDARDPDALELADLEVGAPPEDIGRSDRTLRDEPPPPSFETDDETLTDDGDVPDEAATRGPRGVRGGREGADGHKRGRLVAFLVAVWAELQRVQWPDRRQLTQLTGVVLFFVLIVGAYLGGLDAVFSRLIQAIL
jgi:preprotein translocase subunit SecE